MTSFGYCLNPRYAIKECLSCGALYTGDFCCSKGNDEDKILVPKLSKNCARCGHPVNGPYCQGCSLLRKKLVEDLVTYFQDFQNTSESSDGSTNVVNALREPFIFKQDHGVNPPHIVECCCECGDVLDGIFCQQCTCKSCGKGAHIGYNCPPKILIISNPEPYNQTMNNEPLQTLPSFDPTCYSDKENLVPCVSKPNFVDESSNIFNPPPQPPIYSCEFYGGNDQYGHYCTPQVPFINPKPGYSQVSRKIFMIFNNSISVVISVGARTRLFNVNKGPHKTFHCQPPQYIVNHPIFNAHNDLLRSQTTLMEQMTQLLSMCELACQIVQKKLEEKRIEEEQVANAQYWKIPACCDDDDYNSAFTPVLSTEKPDNSLSIRDEHLDTIPITESDEVIKFSVEDLVPIPSESEGILDTMCDVHLVNNPTPLEAKAHFFVTKSNDDISSSDDDSLYKENIEYVEASPHDSEVVSLEVAEIVIPEDEEIKDDYLREKLLNVHLLISNIKVKENSKKDKSGSKPDKNEKRGKAGKSQKQLQ
nr:hypothetical protein [Tanacetum cinerariifolium]